MQIRIQRPWFQDNFFINVHKLFFVKILIAGWNSYLYGVFLLLTIPNLQAMPCPSPGPILLTIIRVEPSSDYHGTVEIWGKSVKNCQSYNGTDQMVKKEGKKNKREEKTERKQKGFRPKSETLIIIQKKRQNENRKQKD